MSATNARPSDAVAARSRKTSAKSVPLMVSASPESPPESKTLTSEFVRPPIMFTAYVSSPAPPSSVMIACSPFERSDETLPTSAAIGWPAGGVANVIVYVPPPPVTVTFGFPFTSVPITGSATSAAWTSAAEASTRDRDRRLDRGDGRRGAAAVAAACERRRTVVEEVRDVRGVVVGLARPRRRAAVDPVARPRRRRRPR